MFSESAAPWNRRFLSSWLGLSINFNEFLIDLLMFDNLQEIEAIVSSFSITSALIGKRW